LEEFHLFTNIPFFAMAFLEHRFVIVHVYVTGGAGHEHLNDSLGARRVVKYTSEDAR
jgi:hypothetical protein